MKMFVDRTLRSIVRLLPSLLLLALVLALLLRPDANNTLRRTTALMQAGHWRQAVALDQALYGDGNRQPNLLLHLAHLRALRGEWDVAEALSIELLNQPVAQPLADDARLLYGWILAQQQRADEAMAVWRSVGPTHQAQTHVLQAELALRRGDVQTATSLLNTAGPLDGAWRSLAHWRAAQLAVTVAPSTTRMLLDELDLPTLPALLPPFQPATLQPAALAQLATLEPDARLIGLARLWAAEGLTDAALVLFSQIGPDSAYAALAADEAARLRWSSGDAAGALHDLATAVERYPAVATLRRTQATLAASTGDLALADTALAAAVQIEPNSPENHVTSAALALALGDYDRAAQAYDLAITTATITGTYELQAANFYALTPLRACTDGRRYAERAIGSSVDLAARTLAADLALRCDDWAAVEPLIGPLLNQTPDDAHGLYLRGAARWHVGDRAAAFADLERAADLAPGSEWMHRAEELIGLPNADTSTGD